MSREWHEGDVVDGWTLHECLGAGGNGEVWRATRGETTAALKFLKRAFKSKDNSRFRRFRDEATAQAQLAPRFPGVLPLLGRNVPDDPVSAEGVWLATPLATPISKALKDQPLTEVVRAILAIADTLAALHAENVSHRDVKPSNLYQYMGRWVVGDLGLIDFPDKDSITETGERLGPMNFLAPEMLDDGKHAEGAQADVYSLAKTLWVLSTGQRVPPPGELRAGNTQTSIGAYVAHSGGPQLDVLIERATRYAPTARPTMDEIARELSAWLTPSSPSGTPDTARLLAALRARATTFHEVQESRQKESQKMFHLLQLVRTQMANIASAFAETGLSDRQIKYDDGLFLLTDAGVSQPAGGADSFNAQGLVIAASTRGPGYRVGLNCLISTSLRGDGTTLVRGGYVVEWGKSKPELIGYQEHVVASGSAIERNTLTTLIANLCQTLPAALTAFLGFIGRGEAPHPSLDIAAW